MTRFDRRFLLFVPVVLGLATGGVAAAIAQTGTAGGLVQCGIDARTASGMTAIEGALLSNAAVAGSYIFQVASKGPSGNSYVSQGGNFAAGANEPVALGRVSLNADAQYQIVFEVTVDGDTRDCSKPVSLG
jgi:hypothetical protein